MREGFEFRCITLGLYERTYVIASYALGDDTILHSSLMEIIAGEVELAYDAAVYQLHSDLKRLANFTVE